MSDKLELSALNHTWVIDLDGTIVKHNGYKEDGEDSFLAGAEQFLRNIPAGDMVIFLTSRDKAYSALTEAFLQKNGVRYDHIIYEAPYGERIIVNDKKRSGLKMAACINLERDQGDYPQILINHDL